MKQAFAVWLVPGKKQKQYLSGIITYLRQEYRGVPFEPHCTVISGKINDPQSVIPVIQDFFNNKTPLTCVIDKIGCDDNYFKTLYFSLELSTHLLGLHDSIAHSLSIDRDKPFSPHLSLLYTKMDLSKKQHLAESLEIPLDTITFDTIKIISPENSKKGWYDISRWKTLFEMKLS